MTELNVNQATEGPFADYLRLVGKVDQHAAEVTAAHATSMACAVACTGCCHRELSVFPVEAAVVRDWLGGRSLAAVPVPALPPRVLQVLELDPTTTPCAMLDGAGQCRIYPVRPLICRSHGLPLAVVDEEGTYADVCPLSFDGGEGLAELEEDEFLVIDTLNVILAAVNAAWVRSTGSAPERVALRTIALVSSPDGSPGSG